MAKKLLFIVLSILLVSSATAGWFGDLFNKPDLSPVDVEVGIENSAPTIKKIFLPSALGSQYTQPFTGNPGTGLGTLWVGFVVEDANGPADLAQGTGLAAASSVYFEVTAPANSVSPSTVRQGLACDSYACSHPQLGSNCDSPARQLIYVCGGPFLSIDPPSSYSGASPSANDLWTIRAQAVDLASNPSAIIASGQTGFNSLPGSYVQINELSAYNLATTSLSWSELSITTPNQVASAPLIVENFGNVPLTTVQITGSDLIGTNPANPSAILSIQAFSASGSSGGNPDASCDVPSRAIQLRSSDEAITIPEVSIPYTAQGPAADRDEIFICAYQQLNTPGIISGPPSTSYAGTWDITAA